MIATIDDRPEDAPINEEETNESENEQSVDEEEKKPVKEEEVPLPLVGDTFMLKGHEYRVVYINEGKRRFSCVPLKGIY